MLWIWSIWFSSVIATIDGMKEMLHRWHVPSIYWEPPVFSQLRCWAEIAMIGFLMFCCGLLVRSCWAQIWLDLSWTGLPSYGFSKHRKNRISSISDPMSRHLRVRFILDLCDTRWFRLRKVFQQIFIRDKGQWLIEVADCFVCKGRLQSYSWSKSVSDYRHISTARISFQIEHRRSVWPEKGRQLQICSEARN